MNQQLDLYAELRHAYLFSELSDKQLACLIQDMREIHLKHGEILFSHGELAEHFFMVRSGLIKLYRLSSEGDEKIIELMGPGKTFAEAVMFMDTKGRYPVNAEAVNTTCLFCFEHKTFLDKILRESQEACFKLLGSVCQRVHMLVNQIDGLTLQNATYRLVSYLLSQIPNDIKYAGDLELSTPKCVIAARLAIQPETLSRILSKLRSDGLIEVNKNHITLRNIIALRKLIYGSDDGK